MSASTIRSGERSTHVVLGKRADVHVTGNAGVWTVSSLESEGFVGGTGLGGVMVWYMHQDGHDLRRLDQ
jgi:hypothetical protein